jgi:hypothetical protein
MTQVTEVNCETGETITRDMTPDELAQLEKDRVFYQEQAEAQAAAEAEAGALKAAALAKLTALGLSEEEAKAIAG